MPIISPQAYLTDISKESGLNINYIEKKWDEAKTITKEDMNNKEESEWSNNEWNYCKGVLKSMLGIKENLLNKFLNSKYSAKEFFNECVKPLKEEDKVDTNKKQEDAQVSTSLGNVSTSQTGITPPSKEKEDSYDTDAKKEEAIDGNVAPVIGSTGGDDAKGLEYRKDNGDKTDVSKTDMDKRAEQY